MTQSGEKGCAKDIANLSSTLRAQGAFANQSKLPIGESNSTMFRIARGFTMVETILVVGIVAFLLGLVFMGVIQARINMIQLEVDATAKEIFVAAQNHLYAAESQRVLKGALDPRSLSEGTFGGQSGLENEKDVYYFAYNHNPSKSAHNFSNPPTSALDYMLPFGSIDEAVRTGGSYIIRYKPSTSTVLGVLYARAQGYGAYEFQRTSDEYKRALIAMDINNAEGRRTYGDEHNGIVGYYGGEDMGDATLNLKAPSVTVKNGDKLTVEVSNPRENTSYINQYNTGKESDKQAKLSLKLIVEGKDGAARYFDLTDETSYDYTTYKYIGTKTTTDSRDLYPVVLDDVTSSMGRFYKMAGANPNQKNDNDFVPGEELSIYAWATAVPSTSGGAAVRAAVVQSSKVTTNSLFADDKTEKSAKTTGGTGTDPSITPQLASQNYEANISSFRHLSNLATAVSGFNPVVNGDRVYSEVTATQMTDMSWSDFRKNVAPAGDSEEITKQNINSVSIYSGSENAHSDPGKFLPVTPGYALKYNGKVDNSNLVYRVSDVVVNTEDAAGLFGNLAAGSTVEDLELVDFDVTSINGSAGALVGEVAAGSTIKNVLVRDSATEKNGSGVKGAAAGGLIGLAIGENAKKTTIEECAAAVLVKGITVTGGTASTADTKAGGLIGSTSGSVEVTDSYSGGHTKDGKYFEMKTTTQNGETVTEKDYIVNVDAAMAGGLIGSATGTTIKDCYSTCSAGGSAAAGGLVGKIDDGAVNNCYVTGLISGTATNKGVFIGQAELTQTTNVPNTTFNDDLYYDIINYDEKVKYSTEANAEPVAMRIVGNVDVASASDAVKSAIEEITAFDADTQTYNNFVKNRPNAGQKVTEGNPIIGNGVPYDTDTAKVDISNLYQKGYPLQTIAELKVRGTDNEPSSADMRTNSQVITHYGDWPAPETLVVNVKSSS